MGTGPRRVGASVAALAALLAVALASCGDDPAMTSPTTTRASVSTTAVPDSVTSILSTTTAPPGPLDQMAKVAALGSYRVGEQHLTFVDETRDTPANGAFEGAKGRRLATIVWYPATGAASADKTHPTIVRGLPARPGRYPLVVFGHGVTAHADLYTSALAAFASAGYVVVAPDFPLSNGSSPGGPTTEDVVNQPGDMAFLIDRFTGVALPAGEGSAPKTLAGLVRSVDPDRIVVGGHSLGAITALATGFSTCCVDGRVDAVFDWAGGFYPRKGRPSPDPTIHNRPLLIIHGDQDESVPYSKGKDAFARAEVPRWFITLVKGGHVPAFLAGYAQVQSTLVIKTTVRFLDAELKGDAKGLTDLVAMVKQAGPKVATIKSAD